MGRGIRRCSPAFAIATIALFAALAGTVYAGSKIDGKTIKLKSLPGNRLALGSVPGNRLKAGAIAGSRLTPGSVTGNQIDAATLGTVPTAVHADNADSARDAGTALSAVFAEDARRVNGYTAGCVTDKTRLFAGSCWQVKRSGVAVTAATAALSCASQGGELPSALTLAAFAQQQGIVLASGGEWSGDVSEVSGPSAYSVVTVSPAGGLNDELGSQTREYRCVIPLVG